MTTQTETTDPLIELMRDYADNVIYVEWLNGVIEQEDVNATTFVFLQDLDINTAQLPLRQEFIDEWV